MNPIRIVIVDDHTLVREGLIRVVSEEPDITVVGAGGDGAAALKLAKEERPDLLLLDIALPDSNGLSLIAGIRAISPQTRVLILTMYAEPEYAFAARERGAGGLISKAASPESLLAAIRAVARDGTLPVKQTLSQRERQVLRLISEGRSNAQIAAALGIQPKTVEGHGQRLMKKLAIHTRAGLVTYGRRLDL